MPILAYVFRDLVFIDVNCAHRPDGKSQPLRTL
jgi:hypothetical protein